MNLYFPIWSICAISFLLTGIGCTDQPITINGVVVDEFGDPLGDVHVRACYSGWGWSEEAGYLVWDKNYCSEPTQTNHEGVYTITFRGSISSRLRAKKDGYVQTQDFNTTDSRIVLTSNKVHQSRRKAEAKQRDLERRLWLPGESEKDYYCRVIIPDFTPVNLKYENDAISRQMRKWISLLWLFSPGLSADVLPSNLFAPAILFNSAIVLDGSYNESLLAGMEQFEQQKGVPFNQMATADPVLYRQSLESLAMAGHSPIIVPGGGSQAIVEAVAPSFPETTFISIGYQADAPNVRSILFREWDGAYLAGVLAAYRSPNRKVAFMGGLPVRSVKELEAGFRAGFSHVLPDGQVTSLYLSDYSGRPWDDESKARELGRQLFSSGLDIVFADAGSSGKGALAAAAEAGKLAIGVDQNQNGMYPGHVLTSVVKHLDRAV